MGDFSETGLILGLEAFRGQVPIGINMLEVPSWSDTRLESSAWICKLGLIWAIFSVKAFLVFLGKSGDLAREGCSPVEEYSV